MQDSTPPAASLNPDAVGRPTALAGRLTAREFLGLLHVLSQSLRSGRLTLTSQRARALIILRRGRLIYAASSSARETLGNILICEQLIDEQTLQKALEIQHEGRHQRRLGSVLQQMNALSRETLELVVELQARRVMQEILSWERGFFHFEAIQVDESGEIALELDDFVVEEGLRIDSMLFDLSVSPVLEDLRRQAQPPEEDILEDLSVGPSITLRAAMQQITHPLFNAEMTLALLDYASGFLDRGVLLIRRSDRLLGMAQFGLAQSSHSGPTIRDVEISLDDASSFQEAVLKGDTRHALLAEHRVDLDFLQSLGEAKGEVNDAVLIPLIVRDEVAALFYGDTCRGPIRSVLSLESLMLQASVTIEKGFLQRRVDSLEAKLEEQRRKEPDIVPPAPFVDAAPEPQRISTLLAGRAVGERPSLAGADEASRSTTGARAAGGGNG